MSSSKSKKKSNPSLAFDVEIVGRVRVIAKNIDEAERMVSDKSRKELLREIRKIHRAYKL